MGNVLGSFHSDPMMTFEMAYIYNSSIRVEIFKVKCNVSLFSPSVSNCDWAWVV